MAYKPTIDKILRKIRGGIISESILVELDLNSVLHSYFFSKNSEKSRVFYWKILNTRNISFEDKIRIFKEAPSFKKWKKHNEIIESLKFIQKLRNQVAHWDVDHHNSRTGKIMIYNPIKIGKKITIDKTLLKKFDQAIYNIHFNMCKNHEIEYPETEKILESKNERKK